MCQAQKCPVCDGKGGYYSTGSPSQCTSMCGTWLSCHGCGGLGWVTVHCSYTAVVTWIDEAVPTVSELEGVDSRED